ncbi:MAG: substrate-binding domain-containing protein [Kiritimatiellia bacterium]
MTDRKAINLHQQQDQRPIIGLATQMDPWLRAEASARGWRLLNLWQSGYFLAPGIRVQGVVSATPLTEDIWSLHHQGTPVVRLGQMAGPDDGVIPAALFDMAAEGRLAAEHFFERGFRDVGFFGMDPWSNGQILFESFRDRAKTLGMTCHLFRMKQPSTKTERRHRLQEKQQAFSEWLNTVPKPIGLLALSGWFATSYCGWALQAGFTVPDDVAVVGAACDPSLCECSIPTITTIDRDEERRSRAACKLLAERMQGKKHSVSPLWIQPPGITERESTNVLATRDRDVAAALRFMWSNLHANPSVEDVARHVNMSSRQLERRFQAELAHGISTEIQRRRLQELRRLLVATDIPIADLAPLLGFGSTSYLHRMFKDAFGTTPLKYRRSRNGAGATL